MRKVINIHLFFLFCYLVIACEKEEVSLGDPEDILPIPVVEVPHLVSSNEVLERAYQMATMEWTPICSVPMRGGGYYEAGVTVEGVPYSSVKEINTYLFQDVSYYTFITALHNPNSVIYTENISEEPYHGANGSLYYGSVCSSSVMWAMGFRIPYTTYDIVKLPYIKEIEHQMLDSLKVCDILWKSGHVQMVFEVEHKADTLYRVKLFEQSGTHAHIRAYTKAGLRRMWEDYGYVAYRYEYLSYSDEPAIFKRFEAVEYNDDLCPSKGDKAVYRTDDTIVISIFNHDYKEIVLLKDGEMVSFGRIVGDLYEFHGLKPGIYEAFLRSEGNYSSPISFETVETDVMLSVNKRRNEIAVSFNSSAIADYVVLYRMVGPPRYFPISDQERMNGLITVPTWDVSEYYCKVVFRGEYGSIISHPIRVL